MDSFAKRPARPTSAAGDSSRRSELPELTDAAAEQVESFVDVLANLLDREAPTDDRAQAWYFPSDRLDAGADDEFTRLSLSHSAITNGVDVTMSRSGAAASDPPVTAPVAKAAPSTPATDRQRRAPRPLDQSAIAPELSDRADSDDTHPPFSDSPGAAGSAPAASIASDAVSAEVLPAVTSLASDPSPVTEALTVSRERAAAAGGLAELNVYSQSAVTEIDRLRTLLAGLEDRFYDSDKLLRLLLPAMTEAVRDRLKLRQGALVNVLKSEMAMSIEEQVAIERDALIDALYPVIGATVSEYVAETIRAINAQVSARGGDRALLKPIRPTETRSQQESADASTTFELHAVYLIHKASGLVLAEAQAAQDAELDPEAAIARLTAIRSFADALILSPPATPTNLNLTEHEGIQIAVEMSEICYLAAAVTGDPPFSLLQRLRATNAEIELDFGADLKFFEGNPETVPADIYPLLLELLQLNQPARPRRRTLKLLVALAAIVGLAAGLFGGYRSYRRYAAQRLDAEVQRVAVAINSLAGNSIAAQVNEGVVTLEGNAFLFKDANTITQTFEQVPGVRAVVNEIAVKPEQIGERVYFYANSTTVSPRDIGYKLPKIKQLLQQYPSLRLRIIGHQHPDEVSSENEDLSLERALAVQFILIDQGVDPRRMEATGTGEPPADVAENQQAWLSQAVVFQLIPDAERVERAQTDRPPAPAESKPLGTDAPAPETRE